MTDEELHVHVWELRDKLLAAEARAERAEAALRVAQSALNAAERYGQCDFKKECAAIDAVLAQIKKEHGGE